MHAFDVVIEHGGRTVSLLVVQAHRGESIADALERTRLVGMAADTVVVRAPVDAPMTERGLNGDGPEDMAAVAFLGARPSRFGRARDRSVHVLASEGGEPFMTGNLNPDIASDPVAELGLAGPDLLARIRQRELEHLVGRSKALLSTAAGSVFKAPSGHLVGHFLRVGNIQRDRDAVDAVFFWMLPHLRGVDAVLVDTWSISSIAFNAAKASRTYFGAGDVHVELLAGYVDGAPPSMEDARETLKRLLRAIGKRTGQRSRVLVLISATQSGDLARRLREVVAELDPSLDASYLAVFRLGSNEVAALADFAGDPRYRLLGPSPGRGVLDIDSELYFPISFHDSPVRLSRLDAETHREFFDAYRGTGLVRLHSTDDRTDGTGGHQAVRLDLGAIVKHERFERRLKAHLDGVPAPRAIMAPDHPQALALARRTAAHFAGLGTEVPVVPTLRTGALAEDRRQRELRSLLNGCGVEDFVFVVDDVCASPAALAQIDKQFRTERIGVRRLHLVGIERMPDHSEWIGFARRLSPRPDGPPHLVKAVESVPLPDWDGDRCPWCRELALYDGWLAAGLTLPRQIARRREMLSGRDVNDLEMRAFLHPEPYDVPRLGDQSFFVRAPCSQAEVFAATAAALQTLRSGKALDQPRLAERHYPVATPLDDQDYLEQKWTDTVIRASIMRAATRDELVWTAPQQEARRTARFQRLLAHPEPHECDLSFEVLLAACLGKAALAKPLSPLAGRDDGSTAFLLARLEAATGGP